MDRGAVLELHQLIGGVVDRDPVDRAEVEEDDVRLVAGRNPADALHAQRHRADEGDVGEVQGKALPDIGVRCRPMEPTTKQLPLPRSLRSADDRRSAPRRRSIVGRCNPS